VKSKGVVWSDRGLVFQPAVIHVLIKAGRVVIDDHNRSSGRVRLDGRCLNSGFAHEPAKTGDLFHFQIVGVRALEECAFQLQMRPCRGYSCPTGSWKSCRRSAHNPHPDRRAQPITCVTQVVRPERIGLEIELHAVLFQIQQLQHGPGVGIARGLLDGPFQASPCGGVLFGGDAVAVTEAAKHCFIRA